MVSHKLRLDVLANNVANVDTPGFKAGRMSFQDALTQPRTFGGLSTDARVGGGVRPAHLEPSFVQGALQATDSPTDLAIHGDGFFRVRLPDGAEGYTRNGSFRLDATGRLTTADGLALVGDFALPAGVAGEVRIDADGRVVVARDGETQLVEIGRIELARFVNPEGLEAIGQTLFRATAASGAPIAGRPGEAGFGQLVGYALEAANVDLADEMSSLVLAQRAYGLSLKALQTADEMLGLANNLRSR
jgi:flagellar basal-body rod protein FlgG